MGTEKSVSQEQAVNIFDVEAVRTDKGAVILSTHMVIVFNLLSGKLGFA